LTRDPVCSRYVKGERQRRLDRIAQEVERGELIIRQASDAERATWARERQEREQCERASVDRRHHALRFATSLSHGTAQRQTARPDPVRLPIKEPWWLAASSSI
jgi:hypothetical protein